MARRGTPIEKVERLATATFRHGTILAGAKAESIPTRTARRIAAMPEFKAAIAEARREALQTAVGKLSAAGAAAVDRLQEIMLDPDTPPGVVVRAALGILQSLISLETFATLEGRITELEKLSNEHSQQTRYS